VAGRDDGTVQVKPLLERMPDWRAFLTEGLGAETVTLLRRHERTGRPLGTSAFLARIEKKLGRPLRPGKPGRKPKQTQK
jgi:putative transposase